MARNSSSPESFWSEVPCNETVRRPRCLLDVPVSVDCDASPVEAVKNMIGDHERLLRLGIVSVPSVAKAHKQDRRRFVDGKTRRVFFVSACPDLRTTKYATLKELLVDLMGALAYYYSAKTDDERRTILADIGIAILMYREHMGHCALQQYSRLEPWLWELVEEKLPDDSSLMGRIRRTELCDSHMETLRDVAKRAGHPDVYVSTETYRPRGLLLSTEEGTGCIEVVEVRDKVEPSNSGLEQKVIELADAEDEVEDTELVPSSPFRNPSPPPGAHMEWSDGTVDVEQGSSHIESVCKDYPVKMPSDIEGPDRQFNIQWQNTSSTVEAAPDLVSSDSSCNMVSCSPPADLSRSFLATIASIPPPHGLSGALLPSVLDAIANTPPPVISHNYLDPNEAAPPVLVKLSPVVHPGEAGGGGCSPLDSHEPLRIPPIPTPPPPLPIPSLTTAPLKSSASEHVSLCSTSHEMPVAENALKDAVGQVQKVTRDCMPADEAAMSESVPAAHEKPMKKRTSPSSSPTEKTNFDFKKWYHSEKLWSNTDTDAITMILKKIPVLRRTGLWNLADIAVLPETVCVKMANGGVRPVFSLQGERKMEWRTYPMLETFFVDLMGVVIAVSAAGDGMARRLYIAGVLDGISRQRLSYPKLEKTWNEMEQWAWKSASPVTLNLNKPNGFMKHLERCDAHLRTVRNFARKAGVLLSGEVCSKTYFPPGTIWRDVMSKELKSCWNALKLLGDLSAKKEDFVVLEEVKGKSKIRLKPGSHGKFAESTHGLSEDGKNAVSGSGKEATGSAGMDASLSASKIVIIDETPAKTSCAAEDDLSDSSTSYKVQVIHLASPDPLTESTVDSSHLDCEEKSRQALGRGSNSKACLSTSQLLMAPEKMERQTEGSLLVPGSAEGGSSRGKKRQSSSAEESVTSVDALTGPCEGSTEVPVKRSCQDGSIVVEDNGGEPLVVPPAPSLRAFLFPDAPTSSSPTEVISKGLVFEKQTECFESRKAEPALIPVPVVIPPPPFLQASFAKEKEVEMTPSSNIQAAVDTVGIGSVARVVSSDDDEHLVTSSQNCSVAEGVPNLGCPSLAMRELRKSGDGDDCGRADTTVLTGSEGHFQGSQSAGSSSVTDDATRPEGGQHRRLPDVSGAEITQNLLQPVVSSQVCNDSDYSGRQHVTDLRKRYNEKMGYVLELAKIHRKRFPHHASYLDRFERHVDKVLKSSQPAQLMEALGFLMKEKVLEGVIKLFTRFVERFVNKMRPGLKDEMEACVRALKQVLDESKKLLSVDLSGHPVM